MFIKSKVGICSLSLFITSVISGCASNMKANDMIKIPTLFSKTENVIPFDQHLRRKWGAAVVADLDQNGWEDVVTTQHGSNALIYWNEEGKFSKPSVLIKGDTHGLGVSDFNGDGNMNIVVAQGGGNGGNPRRPVYFSVTKDRKVTRLGRFDYFSPSRGRSVKFLDVNQDSKLDIFLTGFAPKKIKSLTTNQLYLNNGKEYSKPITLSRARDALSVKVLTTDVNNDGITDVITFGGKDMTVSEGVGGGKFRDATADVFGDLANINSVNNITEIDYDNDGDFDLFLSRASYQFEKETYYDPIKKNLAFFVFHDNFMFDDLTVEGDNLIIENIQETWATYDIQLGEKNTVVEPIRSEHNIDGKLIITPQDAKGWPTMKKLKGLHIGYLGNGKWRVGGYVKSRLSAVISHVTSKPQERKREPMPARLLENRNGKFVDVTQAMGIDITEQTTSAAAGDFNNDGYVDLAISPYGNMVHPVEHFVLMNNAGKGFIKHQHSGLISQEIGATGVGITPIDYDQDGRLDLIYGNERGRWYFAENQLKGDELGHFLVVKVNSSPKSNEQPVGARVTISACGQQQTQSVGASGDGFHQMLNTHIHFGLGQCEQADEVKITWSNGEYKIIHNVLAGSTVKS